MCVRVLLNALETVSVRMPVLLGAATRWCRILSIWLRGHRTKMLMPGRFWNVLTVVDLALFEAVFMTAMCCFLCVSVTRNSRLTSRTVKLPKVSAGLRNSLSRKRFGVSRISGVCVVRLNFRQVWWTVLCSLALEKSLVMKGRTIWNVVLLQSTFLNVVTRLGDSAGIALGIHSLLLCVRFASTALVKGRMGVVLWAETQCTERLQNWCRSTC